MQLIKQIDSMLDVLRKLIPIARNTRFNIESLVKELDVLKLYFIRLRKRLEEIQFGAFEPEKLKGKLELAKVAHGNYTKKITELLSVVRALTKSIPKELKIEKDAIKRAEMLKEAFYFNKDVVKRIGWSVEGLEEMFRRLRNAIDFLLSLKNNLERELKLCRYIKDGLDKGYVKDVAKDFERGTSFNDIIAAMNLVIKNLLKPDIELLTELREELYKLREAVKGAVKG